MSQIYLNINNQQAGPYDVDGVNQMLSSNQVAPETLGWMQGMANWESLSSDTFKSLGVGLKTTAKPSPLTTNGNQSHQPKQSSNSRVESSNQLTESGVGGTFKIGKAIGDAFSFYKANLVGSIAWLILAIIISVIPVANLIVPLIGVNFYTSVRNYRESGQKMSFGDLFDFSDALDKIIGPIVVGVLIFLGYICLIIPGIILTFMWAFTPCVQGDRVELSFIQAMKESKRLAKGNYIKIFFFVIIIGILAFSGFLLLGFGALITIPVAHVALYCAYDQCKNP
ncbi:MAG: DUF4339 domain-containing protein [Verrucomicrobiota bacterium]|nr:DUF4339 domain-containing protein [Verrucomicrobiota bacterium]